jgi:hypothetical protein
MMGGALSVGNGDKEERRVNKGNREESMIAKSLAMSASTHKEI